MSFQRKRGFTQWIDEHVTTPLSGAGVSGQFSGDIKNAVQVNNFSCFHITSVEYGLKQRRTIFFFMCCFGPAISEVTDFLEHWDLSMTKEAPNRVALKIT